MIAYFPTIYPDELMYSVLSRTHAKSGYLSYTQATEEFFENHKENLDLLFVNRIKPEIVNQFCRKKSWAQVIEKHTMFPYYSRFLDTDKKKKAFRSLKDMGGNYVNLLSITPNRDENSNYLRYCPLCVKKHREMYGETYWSRMHQIPEISVCPVHGCKLKNSSVSKDRHKTKQFVPAETEVYDLQVEYGTEREQQIAQYVNEILQMECSLEEESKYVEYLIAKMSDTVYLSKRGQIINIGLLHEDFQKFYDGFDTGMKMSWQISKILHGERCNAFEIAQLGLFMNIPVKELVYTIEEKAPEQCFDEKVLSMMSQGMSAYKIAEEFGVSKTLIRLIAKNHGVNNEHYRRYVTRVDNNREARILENREVWLQEMKKYSGLSYSKICEKSEHKLKLRWLRRNDVEWTNEHFPPRTRSS